MRRVAHNLYDLDTPFGASEEPEAPVIPSAPPSARIVQTPVGDEIVPLAFFDENTQVMCSPELAALLADSSPHTHRTVPSFHAVDPVE